VGSSIIAEQGIDSDAAIRQAAADEQDSMLIWREFARRFAAVVRSA
jgi:hypothetical protein